MSEVSSVAYVHSVACVAMIVPLSQDHYAYPSGSVNATFASDLTRLQELPLLSSLVASWPTKGHGFLT